jgi:hypothetical protein
VAARITESAVKSADAILAAARNAVHSVKSVHAPVARLTDVQSLYSAVLAGHGKLAKGGRSTVAGQKVIAVNDTTMGGTLYVATTGKPYPIEIAKTGPAGGRVVFDRYNQPVSLSAPADAIDLTKLPDLRAERVRAWARKPRIAARRARIS